MIYAGFDCPCGHPMVTGDGHAPRCAVCSHRHTHQRAQCATLQGYRIHLVLDEEPCDPCREASAATRREQRLRAV